MSPVALFALGGAAEPVSPHVTQWPQRLLLTAVVLAVVGLAVLGMWRGWRNRARRQGDLGELAPAPADRGEVLARAEGRYVGTVRSGQWLDRIVAQGLGPVGDATLEVSSGGVLLDRVGEPPIFIPLADLVGVGTGRGIAGEVVERDGLAIVGWSLGGARLDTGFRASSVAEQRAVLDALGGLIDGASATSGGRS